MKGTTVVIKPDGAIERFNWDDMPPLQHFKDGVGGGYIEVIPYFQMFEGERCVAFCNELGKHQGMPLNMAATTLWKLQVGLGYPDHLVGPIVIVFGDAAFMEAL